MDFQWLVGTVTFCNNTCTVNYNLAWTYVFNLAVALSFTVQVFVAKSPHYSLAWHGE